MVKAEVPDPAMLDPYSRLRHLLRAMAHMLRADVLGAYVLERDGEWLAPVQGYHLPPDRIDVLKRLRVSVKENTLYASGLATRHPVFTANTGHETGTCESLCAAVPHRAEMFVPIVLGDQTLGGIIAAWVAPPAGDLEARDLGRMEALAAEAGSVVQNARLFDAYLAHVGAFAAWRELVDALNTEMMRTVIVTALDAPIGSGFTVDVMELYWRGARPTELHRLFRAEDGAVHSHPARVVPMAGSGLVAVVIRTKRAIRTRDATSECHSRMVAPPADSETYRHWLGVPIIAGNDVVGVLAVGHRDLHFTATHEASLVHTAQQLALAVCGIASRDGADLSGREIVEGLLQRAEKLRDTEADGKRRESLRAVEASARECAATLTREPVPAVPARHSPPRRAR